MNKTVKDCLKKQKAMETTVNDNSATCQGDRMHMDVQLNNCVQKIEIFQQQMEALLQSNTEMNKKVDSCEKTVE